MKTETTTRRAKEEDRKRERKTEKKITGKKQGKKNVKSDRWQEYREGGRQRLDR